MCWLWLSLGWPVIVLVGGHRAGRPSPNDADGAGLLLSIGVAILGPAGCAWPCLPVSATGVVG